ncbi:acyltransferase [Moraxella lacunata]|uniref:Acyltransferase n=1 Tax=Moraxella lacunata TaxID=477 RepID=A0A1V4GV64_MORLA|nr:acyltransferase [Moraxella lacunata]OPH36221.1 acyltransferase [Moraxella lacunata]
MSKTLHQMIYRPDIDGLRALAVLSVVAFHINENWLSGGFLGVDIFFVISGFLITSIIYREINEGKFSFQNFYIRRIRRILPVFFFVMIVGLCFGWYIFLKQDYLGLLKSAIASTAFMANFYFARQSGYFDISNHEKPLLHIWSLSIEEQFYFIFPVIL